MSKIKIWLIILVFLTAFYGGLVWASVQTFNDLRDYYPMGLWIKAEPINTTDSYFELENDTYVAYAIETGNWTWVNQADSEFVQKWQSSGLTDILWLPTGNYYHIEGVFRDGVPSVWKDWAPPTLSFAVLWGATLIFSAFRLRREKKPPKTSKFIVV